MKTNQGIEPYGCFKLGEDEEFAQKLYQLLKGDPEVTLDSVITIELLRRERGVPYSLDMQHCNHEQLATNVKIITKELFKKLNLDL